jgi:phospholipid/cholesterol/gamma-HCH transport system substrate-binding protein
MISQEKATQLRVGIFMAIGLAAVALMVVYFGRFGDGLKQYYTLRVEYPNASGIFKGASVLLAGAKIGMVENAPVILPDMNGVYLTLKIYKDVEIPSKSVFSIGSSGLLGDRFIQIDLDKDAKQSPPIAPGSVIQGKGESGGFAEITESAPEILAEIKKAVENINAVAQKLNSDVFKEDTLKNLSVTMTNLRETSASFAEASKKIDGVVKKAEGTIDAGEQTMVSAKAAADELKKALVDIRGLVAQAKQGRGVLGVLLSDREVAENLKALVTNMRRSGILFYKDRAAEGERR